MRSRLQAAGRPSRQNVVWVPTPDEIVQRMLRMAKVTPQDTVYDLVPETEKLR